MRPSPYRLGDSPRSVRACVGRVKRAAAFPDDRTVLAAGRRQAALERPDVLAALVGGWLFRFGDPGRQLLYMSRHAALVRRRDRPSTSSGRGALVSGPHLCDVAYLYSRRRRVMAVPSDTDRPGLELHRQRAWHQRVRASGLYVDDRRRREQPLPSTSPSFWSSTLTSIGSAATTGLVHPHRQSACLMRSIGRSSDADHLTPTLVFATIAR